MGYKQINVLAGWAAFLFSLVVYLLTVEETASFWDCGEFIATAYKLEVPHPPGAPFFLLTGRIFSMFAMGDVTQVAYWVNILSVLSAAFSILFLFWSITHLGQESAKNGRRRRKPRKNHCHHGCLVLSEPLPVHSVIHSGSQP